MMIVSSHQGGVKDHPALHLFCKGLTHLHDIQIAQLIASFPKRAKNLQQIALGKVTELSVTCAEVLASARAPLYLDALAFPSNEVLERLAKHRGLLSLCGLNQISEFQAGILAKHRGALLLDGLYSINSENLRLLSNHVGMISLNGINQLQEGCAEIISSMSAPVSLEGLNVISDQDAALLAKKTGYLVRSIGPVYEKILAIRTKEINR
jgi:hypothetical protein